MHRMHLAVLFLGQLSLANEEHLAAAAEAYSKRLTFLNPVWIKYEVSVSETLQWQQVHQRQWPATGEYSWMQKCEFARKGDRYKAAWESLNPRMTGLGRKGFRITTDGVTVWPSGRENTFMTFGKPGAQRPSPNSPADLAGEANVKLLIDAWQQGTAACGYITRESAESPPIGSLSLRLTSQDRQYANVVHFLPNQQYAILRCSAYGPKGQLLNHWEAFDYDSVGGCPYPKRARRTDYIDGRPARVTESVVTFVETRHSKIPDSLFEFTLPEGAVLWDDDAKVIVRRSEISESHLNEVVARLDPQAGVWKQWVHAAVLLLLLVGVVAVVRVKWGRR